MCYLFIYERYLRVFSQDYVCCPRCVCTWSAGSGVACLTLEAFMWEQWLTETTVEYISVVGAAYVGATIPAWEIVQAL